MEFLKINASAFFKKWILGKKMKYFRLLCRKELLHYIGFDTLSSRSSWPQDLGSSIAFDAWQRQWKRDAQEKLISYPLRTEGRHYDLSGPGIFHGEVILAGNIMSI